MFWTRRSLWHVFRGLRGVHWHGVIVRDGTLYAGYTWLGRVSFTGMCCRAAARMSFDYAHALRARVRAGGQPWA
jgi:hypothetical protein